MRVKEKLGKLGEMGCLMIGGRVSRDEANRVIADADYLLLLDLNETGESVQVPAKLFDYACAERPVLTFTSRGSPVSRILPASGIDHACLYRDSTHDEIDDGVLSFFRRGPRLSRPGEQFRAQFDGARQTADLAAYLAGDPDAAGAISGGEAGRWRSVA
jgi:hypothetical protein